jgi:hypothetical protein
VQLLCVLRAVEEEIRVGQVSQGKEEIGNQACPEFWRMAMVVLDAMLVLV